MKVKPKHDTRARAMSPQDALRHVVNDAPDRYDGTLEALSAKVDKLAQIAGVMIERLPPEAVVGLLNELHYDTWEQVEEGA
jgi:hypothetical protein